MADEETTALTALTDMAGFLPEPVQNTFIKALSRLLGGAMAIPAAKLKQYAQGIEDTTSAKSNFSAALAKAASDSAIQDQQIVEAAKNALLPDAVRKIHNRYLVAQNTAKHLSNATENLPPNEEPASIDNDWMNNFIRFAEDASSERLQDLFGRILAGEVARPGAFGLATLRAVSELDQQIANDFLYAWSKSVGDAVDYSAEWQRGEGFQRWKRLSEAGLLAIKETVQFLPPFREFYPKTALWSPMQAGMNYITVHFQRECSAQWTHIDYTRIGREIGTLLEKPNYGSNMRQAAKRLPEPGIIRIELNVEGKSPEIIWPEKAPT